MLQLDNNKNNMNNVSYNSPKQKKQKKEKKSKKQSKYVNGTQFNVSASFKQKKEKPLIIKLGIFIFIFAIIALTITFVFIQNYTSSYDVLLAETAKKYSDPTPEIDGENYAIISDTDTFNENDVDVKIEIGSEGDLIKSDNDKDIYKVNYTYPKINGLRSYSIQEKINSKIKETALEMYTEEDKNNLSISHINIDAKITGNFSNVLSVKFEKKVILTNNKESDNKEYFEGRNFNLQTGEEISFSDIFTNGTNIKELLYNKAYYYLMISTYGIKNAEVDIDRLNYIKFMENKVFEIVNAYERKDNFEFCFSQRDIEVYIGGEYIKINILGILDKIAIYKRFAKLEDIYNGRFEKEHNKFLFTEYNKDDYYHMDIERTTQNSFFDIRVYLDENLEETEAVKNIKKSYMKVIDTKKDQIKMQMDQNKDMAMLYTSVVNIIPDEEDETRIKILETNTLYEMSKDYFESTFLREIVINLRTPVTDIMFFGYKIREEVKTQITEIQETVIRLYDKETGEDWKEPEPEPEPVQEEQNQNANDVNNTNTNANTNIVNTNENVSNTNSNNTNTNNTNQTNTQNTNYQGPNYQSNTNYIEGVNIY